MEGNSSVRLLPCVNTKTYQNDAWSFHNEALLFLRSTDCVIISLCNLLRYLQLLCLCIIPPSLLATYRLSHAFKQDHSFCLCSRTIKAFLRFFSPFPFRLHSFCSVSILFTLSILSLTRNPAFISYFIACLVTFVPLSLALYVIQSVLYFFR
jgi:hypothetical protein